MWTYPDDAETMFPSGLGFSLSLLKTLACRLSRPRLLQQIGCLPTTKTRQPCYTYLWSFAFKNYSTAQNAFLFHNWIAGLILPLATTIMSFFEGKVAVSWHTHTHTHTHTQHLHL